MLSSHATRALTVTAILGIGSAAVADAGALTPRAPLPKRTAEQLVLPISGTGRLIVKFMDQVRARVTPDGGLYSLTSSDLDPVQGIATHFGVELYPAIGKSEERLAALQARAAAHSGKAQPDLAGMMIVEGARNQEELEALARALNELPSVEFVEFEKQHQTVTPSSLPQVDPFDQRTTGPLVDATNAELKLNQSVVAKLQVPARLPKGEVTVQVPIDGHAVEMKLVEHSILGPDFQFIEVQPDGSHVKRDASIIQTFRGVLPAHPDVAVAGAFLEDGLYASVAWPDGSRHWIQPLAGRVAGAEATDHAIYQSSDVAPIEGTCGTADHSPDVVPAEFFEDMPLPIGGFCGGVNLHYAEIALDLDHLWVEKAGSVAKAGQLAAAVINVINLQYEASLEISHVMTAIIARPTEASDPYTTIFAGDLLTEFANEWEANFTGVQRDITHLFTGRELFESTIGIARLFGVCNAFATGANYGLAQRFSAFACQTDLSAHELGHNWGAFHCDCFDETDPTNRFTMNPFITCANQFSMGTIASIELFRDYLGAFVGCIDCDPAPPAGCGVAGTGACNVANGTPYCKDSLCCGTVCAVEAFCCDVTWDAMCATMAADLCEVSDEHCLAAHNGLGCAFPAVDVNPADGIPDCYADVIAADPACEDGLWDEGCAVLAWLQFSCFTDGFEDTPDLTGFQAYNTATPTENFSLLTNAFLGEAFGGEGFDLQGVTDLGDELVALGVGTENLARGKSINIATIEDSAYVQAPLAHEDLTNLTIEDGQRLWMNPLMGPDHGTAVLGIIGANENSFGMTGIAPEADLWFFPSFSLNEGGRLLGAMTSAYEEFGPGDVVNYSIGFGTGCIGGDCPGTVGFLTLDLAVWTLVRLGSDLGVTSVMSAGNEGCSLDDVDEAGGDSGGIIVSASDPGFPYCRRNFSNHTADVAGIIPHVSQWGVMVPTTGFTGELFGPEDPTRQYTLSFNGTSASSPMIAGLVARLQGLAKQLYGIPLAPEQIRDTSAGFLQCLQLRTDPTFLGSDDGLECAGDDGGMMPPGEPNYIGIIPSGPDWAANMLTSSFFDGSPLVEDIIVVRGTQVFGNKFSVKSSDSARLGVTAQFTPRDFQPSAPTGGGGVPFVPQIQDLRYLATGNITDLIAIGKSDADGIVNTMIAQSEYQWPTVFTLVFVEGYDWRTQRWSFIDLISDPGQAVATLPDGDLLFQHTAADSHRFVRVTDGKILLRFWTLGFPSTGALGGDTPDSNYRMRMDFLNLFVSEDPGASLP
ncbi:MAG: S8 family serine peptidase [Phycisphaerales bacterium]|nr:S8 family serine peptidase [Phycisphaerales bacterium]